ncbi:hypothetical protein [Niastella yeongjuensis]|nr:hypothetical protein [Niastella yeongjuensis]SEP48872.1 hypothetical protein SAMN05660816_06842 [Niastella yeongjuensis]
MKKEKLSFLILFVEIAAIVFLHSAKNHQADGRKVLSVKKTAVGTSYQLKALGLTKDCDLLSNFNFTTAPRKNHVLTFVR